MITMSRVSYTLSTSINSGADGTDNMAFASDGDEIIH